MKEELVLDQIHKTTDQGEIALFDISFSLTRGDKLSILGPSGSGKTTLLRIISGLEKQNFGTIRFNGRSMDLSPPHKRNFGMMFQEFALFPHLNVFDNIGFGLKMKGWNRHRVRSRVDEMLDLVNLTGFGNRNPLELSGGERQRVALARTLAPRPELVMLDEPLSSLDRVLRKKLLAQLVRILSSLNITTIFVTHDHEEAFAAGQRIMILNQGRIEQSGTPEDLIRRPANEFVRSFIGSPGIGTDSGNPGRS
ncbi:ABC transporter ATP-binding protein [Desulfospira joergensenii]|uniref:ABC transporter ATP-binding protein n=1 Tax=Desulfospira joergensenii TaxID=53329 RepID=UPI0003B72BC5|nr:ABC transporter ATP-binding protein [Desulfospira joergensenii]